MSRAVPKPSESSTRTGMIFAFGTSPVSPTWLLSRSAIVPATWVPCPSSSSGNLSLSTKSWPGMNCLREKSGLRRNRGFLFV